MPRRMLTGVIVLALATGGALFIIDEESTKLDVSVSGLPKGAKAKIEVKGPKEYTLTGSRTLEVEPGRYRVVVKDVTLDDKSVASGPESEVTVAKGQKAKATAEYQNAIAPNTRVVSPNEPGPLRTEGAKVYFKAGHRTASALRPGQYLLAGSTEHVPHPLVREVVSVSTSGGETVVDTKPARLSEAMPQYRFEILDRSDTAGATGAAHAKSGAMQEPASYAAYVQNEQAEPLVETTAGNVKIGGELSVADVHTAGCSGELPPIIWQLNSLDPTIRATVTKKTVKVGGKYKAAVDAASEKLFGKDLPDVTITNGIEASVEAGLTADQKMIVDGPLSGECSYEYDVLEAAIAAASLGTGSGMTKARKVGGLLKSCKPKVAWNALLDKVQLPCETKALTLTDRVSAHDIQVHGSFAYSSFGRIEAGFNAEFDPFPKAAAGAKADLDPFTMTGPSQGLTFRGNAPDLRSQVGVTLQSKFEYSGGDPMGVFDLSLTAAASVAVDLVYRPNQQQSVMLEGTRKLGASAETTVNPTQLLTPIAGVAEPVSANIGDTQLIGETCKIAGPWYPFGKEGEAENLDRDPCKLSTDRGEASDSGRFETLSPEPEPEVVKGPRQLPDDLRLPVITHSPTGRYLGREGSWVGGPDPKLFWRFDPCFRQGEGIDVELIDPHITDGREAYRKDVGGGQQIVAFDSVKAATAFVTRFRADAENPDCKGASPNAGDVVDTAPAPVAGFAARTERDLRDAGGVSSSYQQVMRVANTVVLTYVPTDRPATGIGSGARADVTEQHKKFAKYLCSRKEWQC